MQLVRGGEFAGRPEAGCGKQQSEGAADTAHRGVDRHDLDALKAPAELGEIEGDRGQRRQQQIKNRGDGARRMEQRQGAPPVKRRRQQGGDDQRPRPCAAASRIGRMNEQDEGRIGHEHRRDRKSTRLNSSHTTCVKTSRMPSSA